MEDVDNDLEIIEHDPLAGGKTVHGYGFDFVVLLQACRNFTRDRFQLRLGSGRTDDKEIGKGGNPTQIQNDDVFGLFVRGKLGAGRS